MRLSRRQGITVPLLTIVICRTTRTPPCCGRYIGLCAGGTSDCGLLDSHRTSSSPSSPCPQPRHTTVPARSSSRAAPASPHQRPLHSHRSGPRRLTYPAHPTTPRRIQKRRSRMHPQTHNSRRRTPTRLRRRRPARPSHRRLQASCTRSSTNLPNRVSRSPSSYCRHTLRLPRRPPPRGCSQERFVLCGTTRRRARTRFR